MAPSAAAHGRGRPARAPCARATASPPAPLRLATLVSAAAAVWLLGRSGTPGDLRGFFKGVGLENPAGQEQVRTYRVDNSAFGSTLAGLAFRGSKNDADKVQGEGVDWEDEISGVDEGDGWLKVADDRYLPFEQKGVKVLVAVNDQGEEEDWKDAQYRKQMERVKELQRKARPDYRMNPQELLEKQRRKAVWKAMAERGTEQVFDKDFGMGSMKLDGEFVTVELEKPLGINFLEVNPGAPCGALVGEVADGMAAANCEKIQIGDLLVKVGGYIVQGLPLDEAIQPIIETEGSVKLTFFRSD